MCPAKLLIPLLFLSLTACDQFNQKLGLEDPAKKEARLEAEGKAVGGACRHSGRAIEDCYSIYSWLPKSPIFTGWRDMDAYMRENKIDTIDPQLPPPQPPTNGKKKKKSAADGEESDKAPEKAAEKPSEKTADKAAEKTEPASDKAAKH